MPALRLALALALTLHAAMSSSGRMPLNLAVSNDGEHFRMFYTLEDQTGKYSHPAIIQSRSGDLAMTYTWQRKSIRHVHFPLSDVPK